MSEAGGQGLLKARGYTPKVDSPLASRPGSLKRKRLGRVSIFNLQFTENDKAVVIME